MKAFIDSDVLIWHLRGERKALRLLRRLREERFEFWVGAMQRAEVVFFMRPDEIDATLLFLSQFRTAPVDEKTIEDAGGIYRQWKPSHGIVVNDAILAATVMQHGGLIYTLNAKHYPMPGVTVRRGWRNS